MNSDKILVVDDEPKVRLLLKRCLEGDGYEVVEADNAESTIEALTSNDVCLVTLDIQLGPDNGMDVARRIRKGSDVPMIMVSGQGDVIDRVVGLEIGADDYITKPFHVREMLARVRSVLRRKAPVAPEAPSCSETSVSERSISFDGMVAHLDSFELFDRDGELVSLTTGDFRLLAVFLENPKRILSRDRMMDLLNGTEWTPLDRAIDNYVARLRKKIERVPSRPALIKTVRGVGYMLAIDVSMQTSSQ